jgi:hypothetical protein
MMAAAESAHDPFSRAFQRAMPSPFEAPQPEKNTPLFTYPFSSDGPRIIPQSRLFVAGSDQCAIPLAATPISKDRQFLIRKLPIDKASKDSMASPVIPVCRP